MTYILLEPATGDGIWSVGSSEHLPMFYSKCCNKAVMVDIAPIFCTGCGATLKGIDLVTKLEDYNDLHNR